MYDMEIYFHVFQIISQLVDPVGLARPAVAHERAGRSVRFPRLAASLHRRSVQPVRLAPCKQQASKQPARVPSTWGPNDVTRWPN